MATLRRFLGYLRPYPGLLVLIGVTMLAGIFAELASPRLLGIVIDRGLAAKSMTAVLRYTGLLGLTAIVRAAIHYFQGYSRERAGQEVIRSLRHQLYARLQRLSFAYYAMNPTGDLMSRLTSDVYSILDFVGFGMAEMVGASLMFVGTITVMLVTDWQLALAIMSPVPVLMFFAFRFSGIIGPAWKRIREEMGKMTTTLQEAVSGVRVVKSFTSEHREIGKFAERNRSTLKAHLTRAGIESL